MRKHALVLIAALALAVPTARAQETAGKAAVNDSLFAVVAAEGGTAEVQLSELGLQKAKGSDLKEFSRQMIDEHNKMNQELMTLAQRKGLALSRALSPGCQFTLQALAGESGDDFDRCYAKAQTIAHMQALAAFTAESERGQDPDIKAFAARHRPHIQEHLDKIKSICERYEKDQDKSDASKRSDDAK